MRLQPIRFALRAPLLSTGLGLLLLLGVGACRSTSFERDGDALMKNAQFSEALAAYRQAEAGGRQDGTLKAKIRDAYVASQIENGRMLLARREFMKAVDIFQDVVSAAPDSGVAHQWLMKAERDYSRKLTEDGKDRLGVREYEDAIQQFEKALKYDPENTDARDSLERAKTILQWRQEKGQAMWKAGLRAAQAGDTYIAKTDVQNALDVPVSPPNSKELLTDLKSTLGNDRAQLATKLEADGQWNAAQRMYRDAKLLKSSAPGVDGAEDRMKLEVKADSHVHAAQMLLAKGEFDAAQRRLGMAKELTKDKENLLAIEARLHEVEEKRAEHDYKEAVNMELEGRVEDSVVALKALDVRHPAYLDVREKIDRLQSQVIAPTKIAYQEAKDALAKEDWMTARARLKTVLFLQPFYGDARALLRSVEARLAKSGSAR